jgi:hypothetical protein
MRTHVLMLGVLLMSCGTAAAQQRPDPDDGYWGPRDSVSQNTFSQRWPAQPLAGAPRLDAEGYDLDRLAPPETTGRAQQEPAKPPQPRNSPDPNPLPGEEPRPIPK